MAFDTFFKRDVVVSVRDSTTNTSTLFSRKGTGEASAVVVMACPCKRAGVAMACTWVASALSLMAAAKAMALLRGSLLMTVPSVSERSSSAKVVPRMATPLMVRSPSCSGVAVNGKVASTVRGKMLARVREDLNSPGVKPQRSMRPLVLDKVRASSRSLVKAMVPVCKIEKLPSVDVHCASMLRPSSAASLMPLPIGPGALARMPV